MIAQYLGDYGVMTRWLQFKYGKADCPTLKEGFDSKLIKLISFHKFHSSTDADV